MRYPLSCLTLHRKSGAVAAGRNFEVKSQEDDSAITVYSTVAGGTVLTDPESDSLGHPVGFVASGSYYVHSPDGRFDDQDFEAVTARDQGGRELGYAEITTDFASTTLFSNVTDDTGDVTGLATTVTVGLRPIVIQFGCARVRNSVNTSATLISILEGDTSHFFSRYDQHATAGEGIPVFMQVRLTPSAGSHTYKIVLTNLTAATSTISAVTAPAFIRVAEC